MNTLRERILSRADRPVKGPIRLNEWDEDIWIRTMSGNERLRIALAESGGWVKCGLILVLGLGDAEGARVFEDGDADALAEKNGPVVDFLAQEVLAWNRLRPEDTDAAEKKLGSALCSK